MAYRENPPQKKRTCNMEVICCSIWNHSIKNLKRKCHLHNGSIAFEKQTNKQKGGEGRMLFNLILLKSWLVSSCLSQDKNVKGWELHAKLRRIESEMSDFDLASPCCCTKIALGVNLSGPLLCLFLRFIHWFMVAIDIYWVLITCQAQCCTP